MRVAQLVAEEGGVARGRFRAVIRRAPAVVFAFAISNALIACEPTESTGYPPNETGAPAEVGKARPLELASSEFALDMVTPAGIRVKTNGQYKTEAVSKAAALAIDRYWNEVRSCAAGVERPGDMDVRDLTAAGRRQEDALYIVVVPELNGLGPQMVNELNLWLSKNANVPPTADLVGACASVACVRFTFNNAPSAAWNECKQ